MMRKRNKRQRKIDGLIADFISRHKGEWFIAADIIAECGIVDKRERVSVYAALRRMYHVGELYRRIVDGSKWQYRDAGLKKEKPINNPYKGRRFECPNCGHLNKVVLPEEIKGEWCFCVQCCSTFTIDDNPKIITRRNARGSLAYSNPNDWLWLEQRAKMKAKSKKEEIKNG